MEHKENINEWQQIEPSEWNMVVINENYLDIGDQASSAYDPPLSPTTHHEPSSLQIVPMTVKTDAEDGTSSPLMESSTVSDISPPLIYTISASSFGDMGSPTSDDASVPAPLDWRVRVVNEGKKLLKARLEGVRDRVVGVASKVGNWTMCIRVFWSFTRVAGAAAAVLVLLVYVGIRRRRRRVGRQNVVVDRCVCLLKEKDEKISHLLFQIAQLNEVLSSRRKVPVHQIN